MPITSPIDSTRPGVGLRDLKSGVKQRDLYRTYAMLRDDYPVCQLDPDGVWAISRFDDVRRVLKDWEDFSASAADEFYDFCSSDDTEHGPRPIIGQDPPEHGKYHRLINKAFLDKATKPLVPQIRRTAESLLEQFHQSSPVDFVEHFAYPFVRLIIWQIVGLDDKLSFAELRQWVELEERVTIGPSDPAYSKEVKAAVTRQNNYFMAIMDERRRNPRNDLVTHLLAAEVDGSTLSDADICGLLCLVVSAGFVTTIHMLSHAIILLARKPEVLAELRASPEMVPAFIEELLRYNPSVLGTVRTTTRAVTVAGVEIPAGQIVLALSPAANRDPREYENPDVFDLHRSRSRHLTFGHGIHTCLGAALVRLELRILLETLLTRCTQVVCPSDDELPWIDAQMVRGVSKLPVRFC